MKNKFLMAIIAIIFFSVFFVGINNVKAVAGCGDGDFTEMGGVCFPVVPGLADPQGGIAQILSNMLSWLLGIFTTLAVMAFVISGIFYLTSTGDTEQIEKAKNNAKNALIGVVVGLSGYIILKAVQIALGGSVPTF